MASIRKMNSLKRFFSHQGKHIIISLIVITSCLLVYGVFRPIAFSVNQQPMNLKSKDQYKVFITYFFHNPHHIITQEAAVNGIPIKKLLPVFPTKNLPNRTLSPQNTSLPYDVRKLHDDVTIVTAYFNLGRFQKGDTQPANFTPFLYHQWIHVFARIQNPVIAYFELDEDIELFRRIRQHLPGNRTIINRIARSELWSFGLLDTIREIYNKPGYPKYHPGTVIPEYSATMHAKYELVHQAIRENPFKSKYFSWLDIGLFRSIWEGSKQPEFELYVPPDFIETKIAYGEVFNRSKNVDAKKIFILNQEWVCGCMFIGRVDRLVKWAVRYMNATEDYLARGFMNTDQQVVYAMVNEGAGQDVQVYSKPAKYEAWFHLGYSCMEEGKKRKNRRVTKEISLLL
ncbi:hypothetical protein CAPTEDRAFT_214404 [Capitella teleta]|uniref:Uncharacterized protein n=1 Tax=Capitella teleta TaxID=283909 RepID=R7TMN7_CAPTE|nr:hypothetical protein CAPTEDRAFT_214404 [Capitella teleta]|eukprot:ELT92801.1 hypothetical protein CAPTEDRAFT_214404 [Capitella teleta]